MCVYSYEITYYILNSAGRRPKSNKKNHKSDQYAGQSSPPSQSSPMDLDTTKLASESTENEVLDKIYYCYVRSSTPFALS